MMENGSVLVIDDDPAVLEAMVEALRDAGHFTFAITDSRETMNALTAFRFDVVLSDVMMPGLTGLGLIQLVKRQAPDVEVVFVTGYASRDVAREAWAKGACGFVEKPFDVDRLVETVQQAVWRARLRRESWPPRLLGHPASAAAALAPAAG